MDLRNEIEGEQRGDENYAERSGVREMCAPSVSMFPARDGIHDRKGS
ncbi:MAG: hypothetical protein N3F63_01070 [Thermoplasmata archaeon]|nr:hypothetical protein [Thermoplasmata archaeon]